MVRAYTWARVNIAEFRSWLREETGGVAAEYALLITLIAIVMAVGAVVVGNAISARLTDTGTQIAP